MLVMSNTPSVCVPQGTAVTMDNYDEFILVMNEFVVNAPVENQTDDNLQVVIETARSSAIITADSQTIVAEEVRRFIPERPFPCLIIARL